MSVEKYSVRRSIDRILELSLVNLYIEQFFLNEQFPELDMPVQEIAVILSKKRLENRMKGMTKIRNLLEEAVSLENYEVAAIFRDMREHYHHYVLG